jgi:hypothetical protein
MEESLKEIPDDDGVEVYLVGFMLENGLIVFPTFFNTEQEVLDGISILQPIKPGPVNELIIKRLDG